MAYPRFRLARAHKFQRFTGGDVNITSGSWADLDGSAMDLAVPARVGDTIEVIFSGIFHVPSAASSVVVDVVSVVGGAAVSYWTSNGTNTGYGPWYRDGLDAGNTPFGGAQLRAVVSGDLSGGAVTIRPRGRVDGGSTCAVWRSDAVPLFLSVKNLGPAA
jgi:hypothetical protein